MKSAYKDPPVAGSAIIVFLNKYESSSKRRKENSSRDPFHSRIVRLIARSSSTIRSWRNEDGERGGWKSSVTRMELVIILIPVVGDASYLVGPPVSNLFPVCSGNRWPDHLYECHLAVSHLLPCFSRSKTVIPWLGSQLSPPSRAFKHTNRRCRFAPTNLLCSDRLQRIIS